ncbi:MAG TPA: PUA domain-containing protein [Nitrososphaeraceae archaeon]|nr:PUA domain-containing protein [Nitrososphaeraceae archaeon]
MYRKTTRQELTTLKRAFDRWGIFDYFKDKAVLIKEEKNSKIREVYLLPIGLELMVINSQPSYGGLMVGEIKKNFLPSMQGADLIARVSKKFPYIIVNEIAEKLILYGRNVLGQSIIETTQMLNENEVVILLNVKREPIGIGKTNFAGKSLHQNGKATVITLVDAGCYLRNEKKGR